MFLFDKENNAAILLAGILALIVGVGVARFVFTSLLESMLADFLTISFAGVLASINYSGYLLGAIFSVFIKDIYLKVKFFRFGLLLCIITSILLALTENHIVWAFSRFLAGFGAAMALVVGSAIVMLKLTNINKTKAMGIHFSGIGFSILVTDLIMRIVFFYNGNWKDAWLYLAVTAIIMSCYCIYILSFERSSSTQHSNTIFDKSLFSPLVLLLIAAYFTEGVGMVVQGTFLPDIINSLDGLTGYGGYTWLAVGIAGIPSCILWMRLAHRFGSVNIMIVAMLFQLIGILIPIYSSNIYMNLLSGILYGGTFIGLVALFMSYGGQISSKNPVFIMGAMTSAYGIGQIAAPLYSVAFIEYYHNYNAALYLTAAIVCIGITLLFIAKYKYQTLMLAYNH